METTRTSTDGRAEGAAVACPVCGRPAQATVLRKLISQIFCRRCEAVWQISPLYR